MRVVGPRTRAQVALRVALLVPLLAPLSAMSQSNADTAAAGATSGAAAAPEPLPYKLTLGRYSAGAAGVSTDLNLRRSVSYRDETDGAGGIDGNVWLGLYDAPAQRERQWRLGADATLPLGALRWQPAAQIASHRYAAASLGVETGETWFVGAGFGRTNLKPNTNLNFDPNDSWSLAAGLRAASGVSVQALWIRDNRENPDQRHLHLVWRQPLGNGQRLTVDLLHKQGLVDDAMVRRWGATVGVDWRRAFVRLARDPNVNFTPDTMWRLSGGVRF